MKFVRWILAVVGGFFAYWFVMLMSLGILALTVHTPVVSETKFKGRPDDALPLSGMGVDASL